MFERTMKTVRAAWEVAFGNEPAKGSRVMRIPVDFSLENPAIIDLQIELLNHIIEFVQCAYIDNSANPNSLTIVSQATQQSITVPAGFQGYLPVLCTMDNPTLTCTTVGTPAILLYLCSFPCPADSWTLQGGSTGMDYSANKPALAANLLSTAAVNSTRSSIEVQNQSANTLQVVLDDGAGANQAIILLAPGAGANSQGADWTSSTFRGRLRVFSASALDQVCVHEC